MRELAKKEKSTWILVGNNEVRPAVTDLFVDKLGVRSFLSGQVDFNRSRNSKAGQPLNFEGAIEILIGLEQTSAASSTGN